MLFQFLYLKVQQRFIRLEEVNFPKRELKCLAASLRKFLKNFDEESKSFEIPIRKPEIEFGSTRSEDNFFIHYYKDIIKLPNRHIRFSFRCLNNNSFIKMFDLHGKQLILTEIVNLNHRQLYKNRY